MRVALGLMAFALFLWVAIAGFNPIVQECGRLPVGNGEVWNRLLGVWKGCGHGG